MKTATKRLLKKLGLPDNALLAVSLGLPPDWQCPHNPINMNCNCCGGKLCGKREQRGK